MEGREAPSTLTPLKASVNISTYNVNRYYNNYTEAEIQFELGEGIRKHGLDVYFERQFDLQDMPLTKRKSRVTKIRVDIVVVLDGKILCMVEVKNHRSVSAKPKTRQFNKYTSLGFPFFYCWNETQIEETVRRILELKARI